ncbi:MULTISPECIES: RNase adapter RapZ [Thermoactinomyces]|jgi:RNase adapter protein RapZ|uniref:RNase adapter RapZ n=1 Tax=Thermoactinomyces daqus TaxID=1329516 RepID=A0A7W1XAH9_9BACL|nr:MULTISPECIES: RNase adapter RapZ [Thermoactinomyces]MBA4543037.1 RNase adapter RapZ [Thermoactinomyces daqus]MBH8598698.1 RNase adapter RapZ [Thermoactinomyces sp. CICC 10523]MBH8605043.1 RNase adapter RapZ [Thermoactinomyces sp. CICC 10522]MBH8606299.1 RNase adapter RapZ [Thermoactinomyces sp. CICC 10521]
MEKAKELTLVVITGMSGAGKTVAMQSLEDHGFFCVDNLPPILLPKFAELLEESNGKYRKVALVIDLRGQEFFASLFESLDQLEKRHDIHYQILYLDADDQTLVRRYKETRRRHPLSPDGTPLDGIMQERKLLEEIKGRANHIIDTGMMKPAQLKEKIATLFARRDDAGMAVTFQSFGFKHGIPIDADLVFDVRFLPNPHYVDSLRPQTGKDQDVAEYVMKWAETKQFLDKLVDMLRFLIPQYVREGKAQLVIGIGCTGGKHRSVAIAEYLYGEFKDYERCRVAHRDIRKGG